VTLDPVYHVRAVENVAADLETLARRYGALEVAFSDSLMQPDYFFRLSEEVIRRGLRVKWRGFGRFDRRFTPEVLRTLARAGCHYIIWGMESASPSILKAMRKGNTPAIIHQNLRDAAEAGVHSRACLIYGFPGETPEDSDQTIAFLRERKQWVDSIAFCHYTALRDTPMTREPQQFGLCIRRETQPFALEIAKAPLDASYLEETEQRLRSLWLEIGRRRRSFLQERSLEGTHAEDTL
jgi:radical SAM superfamily enzyme YgiQ (UPF0313 family)